MNIFAKTLAHPIVHTAVIAGVLLGLLACIFPHFIPSFSWVVNYAVPLMLLYLFAGIAMLFLGQVRMTFACFGGCTILCMFLKYSVKSDGLHRPHQAPPNKHEPLPPAENSKTEFKVAQLNLTNVDSLSQLLTTIRACNADLVSIHEVTPEWALWLEDSLRAFYPHHHTMVDLGIFGMALYSKNELTGVDTLRYQEIPNLCGCTEKNGERFCFISVHTEPALNSYSLQRLKGHLSLLDTAMERSARPDLVMGDFNAVSWSVELKDFLENTKLMESRAGFMPNPFVGTSSLFEVPLDHIFYSNGLHCKGFENLTDSRANHLGICGIYSHKKDFPHAEKTAQ